MIRRTLAILVTGVALALVSGTAFAATNPGPASSSYNEQALAQMGQSWAVKAALSKLTPQERAILAKAWLGNVPSATTTSASRGFAWGDFGIGAAAVFGAVLLVGGGLLAARTSRHGHRPQPARVGV
jgi:hypothetical protein